MAKIKIKVSVNNEVNTYNSIYDEELNILKYIEKDDQNTMMIVDLHKKEIMRENKDLKMILTFDTNEYKITNCKFKDLQKEVVFDTKTKKLELTKNRFYVLYDLIQNEEIVNTVEYEITTLEGEFV